MNINDPDQMRAWRLAQPSVSAEEMDRQIQAGLEATRIAKEKWLNSAPPKSSDSSRTRSEREAAEANT